MESNFKWLEHPPIDREDGGLIPPPPFRSWAISFTPFCLYLSEDTVKNIFGVICLVSVPGEVKDLTQGNF